METLRFFTHGPFCATDGERAWLRTRFVRCDESAAALTYTYPAAGTSTADTTALTPKYHLCGARVFSS